MSRFHHNTLGLLRVLWCVLLGGCPSFLPSLPTCVMYSIGCLYLSRYSIVSLQWSPIVSLAAPPLISATSAAQCQFWPHVGCCVLLARGEFLVPRSGPFGYYAAKSLFGCESISME